MRLLFYRYDRVELGIEFALKKVKTFQGSSISCVAMFYLFATAIIIGITMLYVRFSGKDYPSLGLALLHGIFAVVGLLIMIVTAADYANRTSHFTGPLILFCIAALGGIVLFTGYHLKKRPLPKGLVVAHGALAIVAFIWMLA
jgi:FtsH-binding integral membrane protein